MQIERYIDHTLLKPTATPGAIRQLCAEAREFNFYAVCVNSCYVSLAKEELKDSGIKIAAVIGFPLGAMSTDAKLCEAKYCIEHGADEIDMVINLGWLKFEEYGLVKDEIAKIKQVIGSRKLKVIIETCYLTDEEKKIISGYPLITLKKFEQNLMPFHPPVQNEWFEWMKKSPFLAIQFENLFFVYDFVICF